MERKEGYCNGVSFSYIYSLFDELEVLEEQGRIKIIDKKYSDVTGFMQMIIDTRYVGEKKKGSRARIGKREGNKVRVSMDICYIHKNCDDFGFEDKVAEVSTDDFINCKLYNYTWYLRDDGYAYTNKTLNAESEELSLHRLVREYRDGKDAIKDMDIDHINHERNDNTSKNIRTVTRQENIDNKEAIYSIEYNEDTKLYEYNNPAYYSPNSDIRLYFNEYEIEFNADDPVPIADFEEQQRKVKLYREEYNRAMEKLENSPIHIEEMKEIRENINKKYK